MAGPVKRFRVISAQRTRDGFGFFRYAQHLAPPDPPNPLRQIFSIIREHENHTAYRESGEEHNPEQNHTRSCFIVEEEIEPDDRCVEEIELIGRIKNRTDLKRRPSRLTFFRTDKEDLGFKNAIDDEWDNTDADFAQLIKLQEYREAGDVKALECLGYVNLYADSGKEGILRSYVDSAAVVPPRSFAGQTYIHSRGIFKERILESLDIQVNGSYFAQQQGIVTCCAHAALMVALKNLYASVGVDCPVGYKEINDFLSIDHVTRLASNGLMPDEIRAVLQFANLDAQVLDSRSFSRDPEEIITAAYHAVECGLPAIIGFFGGQGHAMAVVGHTFECGLWPGVRAGAYFNNRSFRHLPSHTWIEGLVIQDDNIGPYCTLPRHSLVRANPVVIIPMFPWSYPHAAHGVEVSAANILNKVIAWPVATRRMTFVQHLMASAAYQQSLSVGKENPWLDEFIRHLARGRLVLRVVPVLPDDYISFLRSEHIIDPQSPLWKHIPAQLGNSPLWMVEISVPELYQRSTRRIGEILVKLKQPTSQAAVQELILARLPGFLTFFLPTDLRHFSIEGRYHSEIKTTRSELGKLFDLQRLTQPLQYL